MADLMPRAESYLQELAAVVGGSGRPRRRLLGEIGDHLDDAIRANCSAGMHVALAEQRAVEELGPPDLIGHAWEARCARLRRRRRGRGATLVLAATVASILAAAQHADGRRDPAALHAKPAPVTTTIPQASPAVGRRGEP